MRRALLLALTLLLLVGAPIAPVESEGEPCTVVEKDGQVYVNPEGCVPEGQGNNGQSPDP